MESKFQTVARRERKQNETYQLEKCVRAWLSDVLGKPVPEDFISFVKNGIVLCDVANKIQPGIIPASAIRSVPAHTSPFQLARSLDNVRHFVKILPILGVTETTLFAPNDLVEGKDVDKVINCLYNWGRLCGVNGKTAKMPAPAALSGSRSGNVRNLFGGSDGPTGPLEADLPAPWFHKGSLDRASASILVKANGTPGAFVIYPERNNVRQFNLVLLLPSGMSRHFRIQTLGNNFSLNGTKFTSLNKLVDHHSKWPLAEAQTLNVALEVLPASGIVSPAADEDRKSLASLAFDDEEDIKRQIQSAKEVEESATKLKNVLNAKSSRSPADNKQLETLDSNIRAAQAKIALLQRSLSTVTGTNTYEDVNLLAEAIAVLDSQVDNGDDDEESGIPHKFRVRTFLTPKFCDHCSGFIYGLARQGVKCRNCGFISHKRCRDQVPHSCMASPDAVAPPPAQTPTTPVDDSDTESLSGDETESDDAFGPRSLGKTLETLMREFWKANVQPNEIVALSRFIRLLEILFPRVDREEIELRFRGLSEEELGSLGPDQLIMFFKMLFVSTHAQGLFEAYATFNNGESMTPQEFKTFLAVEQKLNHAEADRIIRYMTEMPVSFSIADPSLFNPPVTPFNADESGLVKESSVLYALRKDSPNAAQWHEGHRIFGPVLGVTQERHLTMVGFLNFLVSNVNSAFNSSHLSVYQDMKRPLSEYYINSSHNTYLEGDQLRGTSSTDAYAKVLLSGCRCIELDLWEGKGGEPVIYHGHTLTSKVTAKDVVETIAKHAFVASEYPVILSLENHLGVALQRIFVQYCIDAFGDKLVTAKTGFWETNPSQLPSPHELKGKIIIKNKAHSSRSDDVSAADPNGEDETGESGENNILGDAGSATPRDSLASISSTLSIDSTASFRNSVAIGGSGTLTRSASTKPQKRNLKIAKEMSDVVVYAKSVGFHSFEHAKQNYKCYEMSSFAEKRIRKLTAKAHAAKLMYHDRLFLVRVYPDGMRFDSSNYIPQEFWNFGVQMAALNFQTPDRAMQINEGKFLQNGNCGYVLKPKHLREYPDPDEKAVPSDFGAHKTTVTIELLSGHQLPKTKRQRRRLLDPYVEVEIIGHPSDEKKFSSSTVFKNGYNPQWDEAFEFEVSYPELALIRFVVMDEAIGPKEIVGQATIPIESLRQGFHHVTMKRPQPFSKFDVLGHSSLFIKATIQS